MSCEIYFFRWSFVFTVFLFLAPVNLSAQTAVPGEIVKQSELKSLFYDKTVEVEILKPQQTVLTYFSPNGELRQIKKRRLYKGSWKVTKGDRLCTKIGSNSRKCRIVRWDGNQFKQYIVKKNGDDIHELTYSKFHQGKKLSELHPAPLFPPNTLNRKQLKKLFSGKTVESVTARKGRVSHSYYGKDGSMVQVRNGQKRAGKWRVTREGRICLKMGEMAEKCRIIVNENGSYKKYIIKKNGRHQHSVSYRNFINGKQL